MNINSLHMLIHIKFLHVSEQKTPRTSRPSSPVEAKIENKDVAGGKKPRPRSYSVDVRKESSSDMNERMKHTRDFKMKGYKGNSRGNFIQAPFTTLEEMFKKLPESIGFNIEMSKSAVDLMTCTYIDPARISNVARV